MALGLRLMASLEDMEEKEEVDSEKPAEKLEEKLEEVRRANEAKRRRELEQIRKAEAENRKRAERERLREEDAMRRAEKEKELLIESLEKPVVALLDNLGLRDELALTLAQSGINSLHTLLSMPRHDLIEKLNGTVSAIEAVDRMIISAYRTDALEKVNALLLPEDEKWELLAASKRADEERAAEKEKEEVVAQVGHAQMAYYAARGRKIANVEEPKSDEAPAPGVQTAHGIEAEKVPVGPLRIALIAVVDRWFDYLSTQPSLMHKFATASRGEQSSDEPGEPGGPTWRDTVAWAVWLLAAQSGWHPGTSFGPRPSSAPPASSVRSMRSDASSGSSTSDGFSRLGMNRRAIERDLKLAQDYAWMALYPGLKRMSSADWRVYWHRVSSSFASFFSEKGSERWKLAAAADARAAALRAGKVPAEQHEAALQAERMVAAMLRTSPRGRARTPEQRNPPPPVPTPQGMAASFTLSMEQILEGRLRAASTSSFSASRSIPIQVTVKQGPAAEGIVPGLSLPTTVVAARATWPPSRGCQRAAIIAASITDAADRYKDTPSRYLDLVNRAGRYKAREGQDFESGARWCPPPPARKPTPSTYRGSQPSTRGKSNKIRARRRKEV